MLTFRVFYVHHIFALYAYIILCITHVVFCDHQMLYNCGFVVRPFLTFSPYVSIGISCMNFV